MTRDPAAPRAPSGGEDLYDLAVVGAGPAGAAAALRALTIRPDARVLLVDRAAFPRDKTCGDGLGPQSVALLHGLGVGHVLRGAQPFQDLEIRGPGGTVLAGRVTDRGCVLPRAVLDGRLVAAAEARGAAVVQERITRVEGRGGCVELNRHLAARVVIGADGANSVVRRQVAAGGQPRRHHAVALRGYATVPDHPSRLEFRFGQDPWPSYAWCFPGPGDRANVGVVVLDGRVSPSRRRLAAALDGAPGRPDPQTVRGHRLPLSLARSEPAHGRILLAGDAASMVNPLSGEGIAAALLSGALAGECAVRFRDPAAAYRSGLRRRLRRHLRHVRLAAHVYGSPALVDQVLRAASRSRRTFEELVALSVDTGHLSPATALRMVSHLAVTVPRAIVRNRRSS